MLDFFKPNCDRTKEHCFADVHEFDNTTARLATGGEVTFMRPCILFSFTILRTKQQGGVHGNDLTALGQASLQDCCDKCNANPLCNAYTHEYDPRRGYLCLLKGCKSANGWAYDCATQKGGTNNSCAYVKKAIDEGGRVILLRQSLCHYCDSPYKREWGEV
jgi:hypothetical protein